MTREVARHEKARLAGSTRRAPIFRWVHRARRESRGSDGQVRSASLGET